MKVKLFITNSVLLGFCWYLILIIDVKKGVNMSSDLDKFSVLGYHNQISLD